MNAKRMAVVVGCITAATLLLLYRSRLRRRWKRKPADYKPQRNFKLVLADNSSLPFIHLRCPQMTENHHPFHRDISVLLEVLKNPVGVADAKEGAPPMTDNCIWIDTKDGLEKAVEVLSKETEFGVDTEQHSIRSFHGFTALLQVSTRKQDFLIDAIALHDEMSLMRNVFADPNICKVFHGADSDILWLQRDFHIYVVNLFDTAKACDVLGKRPRSLAFLLEHYCGVTTNKTFQLADWRIRPLPEEMIVYARIDAHFLLYIADCLRKELLQGKIVGKDLKDGRSMYEECAKRSNLMCLQLYEKDDTLPATIAASLLLRYNDKYPTEDVHSWVQMALIATCEWRDNLARANDESLRYVLSDQLILAIVEKRPTSTKALLEYLAEVSDATSAADKAPYMTHIPSPSLVLLEQVDSLMKVLDNAEKATLPGCIDVPLYKLSEYSKGSEDQVSRKAQQHVRKAIKSKDKEAYRKKFVERFSCKGPVYENCRIYASDGGLLCFCDRKKIDWYMQRGLAEFLDEDPPAIRILFEPKRRPEDEKEDFYLQSKVNRCVGCGETSHYLRYRVVPSCYRQFFPQHLKSHRSHDIVLLCVDCHVIANSAAEKHKKQVATKFGVPLFLQTISDGGVAVKNGSESQISHASIGGVSLKSVKFAAVALLRYGSKIPEERREELQAIVQAYYGGRRISQKDINDAALLGRRLRDSSHRRQRKKVAVDKVYASLKDTGASESNVHCNGTKMASSRDFSDGKVASQDLQQRALSSDSSSWRAGMTTEMVVDSSCIKDIESNEFDDADLSSKSGTAGCHDDLCGVILNNAGECESEETISELEQSNDMDIDGNATHAKEVFAESQPQRVFLQGHTFHGKKVVEMVLESEGEEGINKFCQMWRSVFVEAVKPTHLPVGWNIFHSDYREFGEHSIFNSGKGQELDLDEAIQYRVL